MKEKGTFRIFLAMGIFLVIGMIGIIGSIDPTAAFADKGGVYIGVEDLEKGEVESEETEKAEIQKKILKRRETMGRNKKNRLFQRMTCTFWKKHRMYLALTSRQRIICFGMV